MKKRLFVGIPLPKLTRDALAMIPLQVSIDDARWVRAENLHVTTYFIGAVDEDCISDLTSALRQAFEATRSFVLRFDKVAFIPDEYHRMIWAQFYPNDFFAGLVSLLAQAIQSVSDLTDGQETKQKGRALIPHITLARLKKRLRKRTEVLPQPLIDDLLVEAGHLFASQLTGEGPIYTQITSFSCMRQ